MILGVDTDVLVNWRMKGASKHKLATRLMRREVQAGHRLGFTPQVMGEFIHIVTDPRRFERPMTMSAAIDIARKHWLAPEAEHIVPTPAVVERALELLGLLRLGRKRILDTMLAATFESAKVQRLATFNRRDYEAFTFIEVVDK